MRLGLGQEEARAVLGVMLIQPQLVGGRVRPTSVGGSETSGPPMNLGLPGGGSWGWGNRVVVIPQHWPVGGWGLGGLVFKAAAVEGRSALPQCLPELGGNPGVWVPSPALP